MNSLHWKHEKLFCLVGFFWIFFCFVGFFVVVAVVLFFQRAGGQGALGLLEVSEATVSFSK